MALSTWAHAARGWSVLVHGGAGDVAPGQRADRSEGCRVAADAAARLLASGSSALDAVERAVRVLEDDPAYNAGTGACLTLDGHVEHDASIMEGRELRAGAVCALRGYKNPIAIARAVLEDGLHVFYAAEGASAFAASAGFERVDEAELVTESARRKLESVRARGRPENWAGGSTVGAVARDAHGVVAAATSTGGMAGKRAGRVGDSPVLGAGTYADVIGAASATGNGEAILRVAMSARAIAALAAGSLPEAAAAQAVTLLEQRAGGRGGIILVDAEGRLGLARNTQTMSWAAVWDGGKPVTGF
jgi:beta-aspartyl-peptidase (threonine type)